MRGKAIAQTVRALMRPIIELSDPLQAQGDASGHRALGVRVMTSVSAITAMLIDRYWQVVAGNDGPSLGGKSRSQL
jgi:hypothetical protein